MSNPLRLDPSNPGNHRTRRRQDEQSGLLTGVEIFALLAALVALIFLADGFTQASIGDDPQRHERQCRARPEQC